MSLSGLSAAGTSSRVEGPSTAEPAATSDCPAPEASPEERELSVGSLPTPPDGWLEEGDHLKLGGYVTFVSEDDEAESGAAQRGAYLLLAACVVNESRDQALIHPTALMNCQAWSAGADPESLAPMR